MPIRIDKWYLDLVTNAGDVAIAHHAIVAMAGLRIGYAALLVSAADGTTRIDRHRAAWRTSRVPSPLRDDGTVTWRLPGVAEGTWRADATAPPAPAIALTEVPPTVDWTPVMAAADATLACTGGPALVGRGWVERLAVVAPRPRLPIDVLHWGRFVPDDPDDAARLAWIRWEGPRPLDAAWCGVDAVDPDHARDRLTLTSGREVRLGSLDDTVLRRIPRWARRFGRGLADWREERSVHRAELATDAGSRSGWVVRERVELRPSAEEMAR